MACSIGENILFFRGINSIFGKCLHSRDFCCTFAAKRMIMAELTKQYVYQQDVIEFVTVSVQTCLFLEHLNELERADFLQKITKLLPLLYLKTQIAPFYSQAPFNSPMEGENAVVDEGYLQRFVTEEDYNYVAAGVRNLLGTDDAYLEVFMDDMRYSDEPITAYVSENIADIYQELKDMAANYQTANENVMNDAVLACLESFREHWGQKLLNALRALHALSLISEDEDK